MSLSLDGVDLVHADGQRALADIRLRLAAGERVALIGPSGAGKTSLLRVLASQWRPNAGRVELLGEEPWALSAAARQRLRARIGLVHQAPPLPPRQRVVSAVLAGRLGQWPLWKSLVSLVYPLDRAGAHDALQRLDLGDKLFQRCDQLSGGQLQRVGIARVLYQRAELILADEPVSAMDPVLAGHTLALLNREAAARGSTLLASLVRNAEVDVTVLALVGERGREVREFIESDLGEQGLRRSVLVVATSDRPAMERAKAGFVATSIAEYFRDQGRRVLLLMDSLTRFARAQREIGLAAGEPPTRRGYPPSVFAALPRLMERAGQSERGSITALYTVLVEGDDMSEPVADETRSILDGHIVLSRKLAAANHYPAIDVLHSVSRVMNQIVDDDQRHAAGRLREWLAKYEEVELLLKIGEYQKGQDSEADRAIEKIAAIRQWLRQGTHETSDYAQACAQLRSLCA